MTSVQYPPVAWDDDALLAHLRLPPRAPSPPHRPAAKPLSKLSSVAADASDPPPVPVAFDADAFLARAEARARDRLEKATLAHAEKRDADEREAAEKALRAKQAAHHDEERNDSFSAPASPSNDEDDAAADAFDDAVGDKRVEFDAELEFAESQRVLDARGEEIRRQMAELAEEEAALSNLVQGEATARAELTRRLELASRARVVLASLLEIMANGTDDPELERLLRKTGLEGKPRLPRLLRAFMYSRSSEEIDADLASLLRSFACSPPPPPRRRRTVVRSTSDLRVELLRRATTTPHNPSPPESLTLAVSGLPPKPLLPAPPLDL